MATIAFLLLIASLLMFLASTKQLALPVRGAIWAGGLVALIIATVIVASDNHGGLFRAFGDFAAHIGNPGESILAQSFGRNGPQIARFVLPLLDLFLILGALMGILVLAAFTPGETLEKIARPIVIGLVGAVFGGVLALVIVGTGFGDVAQQRVYSTFVDADDVLDGDTLWVGEVSVRLAGIDAPEADQICRQGNTLLQCGANATRHMRDLLQGALLTCIVEEKDGERGRTQETFGRPLVRCDAERGGRTVDIASLMVADGHAIPYGDGPSYVAEAALAREQKHGMLHACTLRPSAWRNDPRAMLAFRDTGAYPRDASLLVGECPPQRRPSSGNNGRPLAAP